MVHARDDFVVKQGWTRHNKAAIEGLMWCGTTSGKLVNYDLNVALKIRRCLALSVWPPKPCRVAL
eukprot:scaffold217_cov341-Pavlova_lutheri.AAC.6